ncbi:phosphoenolpyruvate carboxykinase (GTP) [Nocardia seriolae]|uniref:Phosphoenolpyruvate carboxykinase [GTP] n=2 Tax=Nocardia seriolae TaxID=37332 RepID=A0A0B8NB03_9NOCA|nr:phosphoenolpyruvate carboxykinase (GTP) [Nocardia seriolae]MTJ64335.1 phosphoenolpyruvate carboxykinase (GTP) [Nocardia seriolae]MTJ74078.1 phosphoenolpyruvate carboxykinase (GTP) [Nocardia seriolae]MTJ87670.1 phosphoenolpyruvate carboxykinase (GTP) [Nocardia seriolae]MTK42199.1 phosphoenolpyruvate carboxykinase (GTP) [Nocardia seriolae]MTK48239.1 phosphoenolpyruvate carboxykinase (GTP) [Nocardia seriolae]
MPERIAAVATAPAPTDHEAVLAWVAEVAELTAPERIVFCDGSRDEWDRLTAELVAKGTFVPLPAKPNSFWCVSDPDDVARVEDRTFICSENERDAGPTNNWVDPVDMRTVMTEHYRGAMAGRTMYVIAYCMGPLDAGEPKFGVQVTDSEYVAVSMQIMTRSGAQVWEKLTEGTEFVKCLHSVGAPLVEGQADVPWPCDKTKYISHFPERREIWSYGSGYGGNALLGKKCFALRIASVLGRDEGWLAEHMLILKLTSPQGKTHYIAAAFPSSCGKTNLAMLEPTLPGWKAETIGDDIAWMRFGADGRLYAVNPEAGFFGVAPGTGVKTNPNAIATVDAGNSIFTNTARTDDGDIWWEGLTEQPPAHLIDWHGRDWTPESGTPAAHPNSRYCTPIEQCPSVAPEWNDPRGVPISAIFFGGRRATTIPLVAESFDWAHGAFTASVLSSETTAAAAGQVGVVRRDPMAMLPFLGYHVGDYFAHWLAMGAREGAQLPKIFQVNWFRRSADGKFLWPGFGDNVRVLKWALERLDGTAEAERTPIGFVPTADALVLDGLGAGYRGLIDAALAVDVEEWVREIESIDEWYATIGGNRLPEALRAQLAALKLRLAEAL